MRAVPGADLAGDPGHEAGSQPMAALRGGCAAPYTQQPLSGANTGAQRPGPNATDADSPTSGHLAGATWTYNGGA